MKIRLFHQSRFSTVPPFWSVTQTKTNKFTHKRAPLEHACVCLCLCVSGENACLIVPRVLPRCCVAAQGDVRGLEAFRQGLVARQLQEHHAATEDAHTQCAPAFDDWQGGVATFPHEDILGNEQHLAMSSFPAHAMDKNLSLQLPPTTEHEPAATVADFSTMLSQLKPSHDQEQLPPFDQQQYQQQQQFDHHHHQQQQQQQELQRSPALLSDSSQSVGAVSTLPRRSTAMQQVDLSALNACDEGGNTALAWAVMSNQLNSVEWLLSHGTDCNIGNNKGRAPLALACLHGTNPAVVKHLLSAGANPHMPDAEGSYPIHFAARHEDPAFVVTLLQHGANGNATDNEGLTPLMVAASMVGRACLCLCLCLSMGFACTLYSH